MPSSLTIAESDRKATWSASSDGSDHHTSRALVGDSIPAATDQTTPAASSMFPKHGIANPAVYSAPCARSYATDRRKQSDKICSRPNCTENTMDNKQQCERHLRLSREAKREKRLRDKAAR
jgi:hypothetical protein